MRYLPAMSLIETHQKLLQKLLKMPLDDWTALSEEVSGLPTGIVMALMASRKELLSVAKKTLPSQEEWEATIHLISVLLETNGLLQQHSSIVAEMMENWMGHFKGMAKIALQIESAASFEEPYDGTEDE